MVSQINFGVEIANILPLIQRGFAKTQKDIFEDSTLTMPQIVILDLLAERPYATMSDIARTFNFTRSAATALINKMIAAKLVRRERSSRDRRIVKVTLLKKGKDLALRLRQARREYIDRIFSPLSTEEKAEYLRILRKRCYVLRYLC